MINKIFDWFNNEVFPSGKGDFYGGLMTTIVTSIVTSMVGITVLFINKVLNNEKSKTHNARLKAYQTTVVEVLGVSDTIAKEIVKNKQLRCEIIAPRVDINKEWELIVDAYSTINKDSVNNIRHHKCIFFTRIASKLSLEAQKDYADEIRRVLQELKPSHKKDF